MNPDNEVTRSIVSWVYREIINAKNEKKPISTVQFKKEIRKCMNTLTSVALSETRIYDTVDKNNSKGTAEQPKIRRQILGELIHVGDDDVISITKDNDYGEDLI